MGEPPVPQEAIANQHLEGASPYREEAGLVVSPAIQACSSQSALLDPPVSEGSKTPDADTPEVTAAENAGTRSLFDFTVVGYEGVYDATGHGVSIIGAEYLEVYDQIRFEADNVYPAISRRGTVAAIDGGAVTVQDDVDGVKQPLQSFLGAFEDVLMDNGQVSAYNINGTISRAGSTFSFIDIKVKINPVEVAITTDSASKVYDAAPLTAGGTVKVLNGTKAGAETPIHHWSSSSGTKTSVTLVDGGQGAGSVEVGDFWTTGTVTDVEKPATVNGCQYDLATNPVDPIKPTNYHITERALGSLQVTPTRLAITTQGAMKIRDGIPLTMPGTVEVGRGTSTNTIDFSYSDSTTPTDWTRVTLVGGDAAYLRTIGAQTLAGSSTNGYQIEWAPGVAQSNYAFDTTSYGTLRVVKAILAISTNGANKAYDATQLNAGGLVNVDKGAVPASVIPFSFTDDSDPSSWTPVALADGETAYVRATGSQINAGASENAYEIDWNDINAQDYWIAEESLGELEVTPAQLYVVTDSATKRYEGTPLTAGGTVYLGRAAFDARVGGVPFAHDGATRQIALPNGETMDIWTDGTLTDLGSATNTWSYDFNGSADAGNYAIPAAEELGTLVVHADSENPADPVDPAGSAGSADPSGSVERLARTGDGPVLPLAASLLAIGISGLGASLILRRRKRDSMR